MIPTNCSGTGRDAGQGAGPARTRSPRPSSGGSGAGISWQYGHRATPGGGRARGAVLGEPRSRPEPLALPAGRKAGPGERLLPARPPRKKPQRNGPVPNGGALGRYRRLEVL